MYLIASSCKCLCFRAFVHCRQMYPTGTSSTNVCELHTAIPKHLCTFLIQLAWANCAHFNNPYIRQQLDVPHTANFVRICCQMWGLLKCSWKLFPNIQCSLFHVTLNIAPLHFELCCRQVPHCSPWLRCLYHIEQKM